jgi:crossover junction endodeoxyribonuclease RuvC
MGVIAGIDPGLAGALAFLDPGNPSTVEIFDIPVHLLTRGGKAKREIDIASLAGILASHRPVHVFIEQVGAMPGQGVSSVFAFGKGYGIVLGILGAHGIPVTLVTPGVWKRSLGVLRAKDAARARASQLLPQCAGQWPLKKDHGKAEASLLALYGLRQLNNIAEQR